MTAEAFIDVLRCCPLLSRNFQNLREKSGVRESQIVSRCETQRYWRIEITSGQRGAHRTHGEHGLCGPRAMAHNHVAGGLHVLDAATGLRKTSSAKCSSLF